MCSVDAPPPVEIEKPTFVRNPFLDEDTNDVRSADSLRRGRSSLVIPTDASFDGRGGTAGNTGTGNPNGNGSNGGVGGGGRNAPGAIPAGTRNGGGGGGGRGQNGQPRTQLK